MSLGFRFRRAILGLITLFPTLANPTPLKADEELESPPDKNVCIAVDVSRSIDTTEYELQMRGVHAAITSNVGREIFGEGYTYALSAVFFASSARYLGTTIVRDVAGAAAYAESQFFNASTEQPFTRPTDLSTQTSIIEAFRTCAGVFQRERDEGYAARHNVMVVMGDGVNNSGGNDAQLEDARNELVRNFCVRIHGVPIIEPPSYTYDAMTPIVPQQPLDVYYRNVVVNPETRCHSGQVVPRGGVFPAQKFENIQQALEPALRMSGG